MFGWNRRSAVRREVIAGLHARIVESSRRPDLYAHGLPDTVEGRFESLTLHVLLVLRRLRSLPAPADEVAQELVDAVFAHLEIALRELGVGDFGVPKRMKKLGQAFYDRTSGYDRLLDEKDGEALAAAVADRLGVDGEALRPFARHLLESEAGLSGADLTQILDGPSFASPASGTETRTAEIAS
jgi:cytochrome b pre-mRNA-processing protein 3